jgi:hypothetical protein
MRDVDLFQQALGLQAASPMVCSKASTRSCRPPTRRRGYRSTRNHIAMIYLTVGKLDIIAHTN